MSDPIHESNSPRDSHIAKDLRSALQTISDVREKLANRLTLSVDRDAPIYTLLNVAAKQVTHALQLLEQ